MLHDVLPVLRSVVTNANNGLLSEGASASSLPLDSDYSIEDAQLEVHCEVKGLWAVVCWRAQRKAPRPPAQGPSDVYARWFLSGEVSGSSIRKRAGAITISAPAFYGVSPQHYLGGKNSAR